MIDFVTKNFSDRNIFVAENFCGRIFLWPKTFVAENFLTDGFLRENLFGQKNLSAENRIGAHLNSQKLRVDMAEKWGK